jgi:hypothetical protein
MIVKVVLDELKFCYVVFVMTSNVKENVLSQTVKQFN